jgi:hypothetical protein
MFEEILLKIGASLNKHNIPYMIIGGQAVLFYGEPRLTRDIERSPFVNYLVSVYKLDQSPFSVIPACLESFFNLESIRGQQSFWFSQKSRKHSGPASWNDINVALLIAVLVTHCKWRSGCLDVSQFELCS